MNAKYREFVSGLLNTSNNTKLRISDCSAAQYSIAFEFRRMRISQTRAGTKAGTVYNSASFLAQSLHVRFAVHGKRQDRRVRCPHYEH